MQKEKISVSGTIAKNAPASSLLNKRLAYSPVSDFISSVSLLLVN
jgi:hypothetical protein